MTAFNKEEVLKDWKMRLVWDTAFKDGKIEGKVEEKEAIANMMLLDNEPIDKIVRYTQLSIAQIEVLKKHKG